MGTTFASAFAFFFFSFFFPRVCETCDYCSCTVHKQYQQSLTFLTFFQPINAHHILFIDPQILLFSNFFIKNESHGTIHTFKNYFVTVFLVFSFTKISFIQTDPYMLVSQISLDLKVFSVICIPIP